MLLERLSDPVGELQDTVVFVYQVERLPPDLRGRGPQQVKVRVHGITDVQQRTPRLPAAVDGEQACAPRVQDEHVHHQIEAHPGSQTKDGALPQDRGGEEGLLLCQPEQLDLRQPLLAHMLNVHISLHRGSVIDRACGGEEEADLALLRLRPFGDRPGHPPSGQHVARAVEIRREVGRRIVRQPGQVNDGAYVF